MRILPLRVRRDCSFFSNVTLLIITASVESGRHHQGSSQEAREAVDTMMPKRGHRK